MKLNTVDDAVALPKAVITVSSDASLEEAASRMQEGRVHNLVVVDKDGRVVGVLAQRALFGKVLLGGDRAAGTAVREKVGDVSVRLSRFVDESTTLAEAIDLMMQHGCSALPILRANKLVGVITETDLLRALAGHLREARPLEDAKRQSYVALANPLVQKAMQIVSDAGI